MKFALNVLILVILVTGCKQAIDPVELIGTWKKDSVYRYYNGYGYTTSDFDEEPLHEYLPDQVLKMKLKNENLNEDQLEFIQYLHTDEYYTFHPFSTVSLNPLEHSVTLQLHYYHHLY